MSVDAILELARLIAMQGKADYAAYESLKVKLAGIGLSDRMYQTALRQLIDALGL